MSKFLLLTLEYPPDKGGVARYYYNLAKHWPEGEFLVKRALLWRFFWPRWLPSVWRLPRWVTTEGVQVVLVGQILPLGYSAWLWRQKTPYVVFTHGLDILLPQSNRWKKFWLLKILSEAKGVIANSQFTAGELKKLGVSEEKIEIVYPTVDSEFFRPATDEERIGCPAFPYILSVGRLVRRKGFDRVIEVLPRLVKFAPEIRYVIAGRGPDKEYLRQKAVEHGLAHRVIFLEELDDTDLRHLYRQCRVFALACRRIGPDVEGFGIVLLEAAACGKPVVVGNSGGAPEAVKHGYSGFLVDPDSADELAQALIKILTDEDFARRLGAYGRQMVLEKFNIDKEVEKLKKLTMNN